MADAPDQPAPDDAPDDSPEEPTGDEPQGPSEDFDQAKALEKIRKANSEAAALRKRLKDLEPLARKAQELEDANKSESQRLTEERDRHRSEAERAAAELMRLEVALERAPAGMELAQVRKLAKRLAGSSIEELEQDADELFSTFAPSNGAKADDKPAPSGRPKERLRPGAIPDAEPEETDPAKLAALVPRNGF